MKQIFYLEESKFFVKCWNYEYCKEKILLFAHGFPGTNRLPQLIPYLRKKEIAWAEINYQGDRGTKGFFSFIGSIEDIIKATYFAREKFNPRKVYILGYSYGGFCTLNIIKNHPSLYDRVILLNPVLNAQFFRDHPIMPVLWDEAKKILSLQDEKIYRKEIEDMIQNYNPLSFKEKLSDPYFLLQSTKDTLCPISLAERFVRDTRGILLPIPNAGHDLEGREFANILPIEK